MLNKNATVGEVDPLKEIKHVVEEEGLVDSWLLMKSPIPLVTIVACYLCIVLKIGPLVMAKRKPYDLKYIMMAYNVFQVIYNAYMVQLLFTTEGAVSYLREHSCTPIDPALNPLRVDMCCAMWHYSVLKLLDLADTVFFVLRKKQSHVTFLHVYHHTAMVLFSWGMLKYVRGEHGVLLGFINTFVHVVMYSYYFLAALGDKVKKYLWWKHWLTRLQITQFVIGIAYITMLIILRCNLPIFFSYIMVSQLTMFLCLFINFYVRAYILKTPHKKTQ